MGTYSKSLAAVGGFIAGSSEVISWVKHVGRSLMFSASLPPPQVAAVSTALDIIEEQPELENHALEKYAQDAERIQIARV